MSPSGIDRSKANKAMCVDYVCNVLRLYGIMRSTSVTVPENVRCSTNVGLLTLQKPSRCINPLSPNDALKHHFTQKRLNFPTTKVFEGEFP